MSVQLALTSDVEFGIIAKYCMIRKVAAFHIDS